MVPDQQAVSSPTAFSPPPLSSRFQPPLRLNSAEEEFPDYSEFLDLADNRVFPPVALPLSAQVSDSATERHTLSEHAEQAGCRLHRLSVPLSAKPDSLFEQSVHLTTLGAVLPPRPPCLN